MLYGLGLKLGGGTEIQRRGGRDRPLAPGGDLLRANAAKHQHHLQALTADERTQETPQRLGLARPGLANNRHT